MNPCPFCGAPLLLESIPARYGCGTHVGDRRPYNERCMGREEHWFEIQRLRDIIRRASKPYCRPGRDSAIAAEMFTILSESIESK